MTKIKIHYTFFLILLLLTGCCRKEMKQQLNECNNKLDSLHNLVVVKSDSIELYMDRLEKLKQREIAVKETNANKPLTYINNFKRMYPFEVNLYTEGVLAERLAKLLGEKEFKRFRHFNSVQGPIETINDDRTSIIGIAPHGGGTHESFLYIDFVADEISVALYHSGDLEYYTEQDDRQRMNAKRAILKWMIEKVGIHKLNSTNN